MKVLDAVVQGRVSELNTKAAELRQRIERQLGSMQDEEEAAEQEAALGVIADTLIGYVLVSEQPTQPLYL